MTENASITSDYKFDQIDQFWLKSSSTKEVSVGIYRMVPKAKGKGTKRSPGTFE